MSRTLTKALTYRLASVAITFLSVLLFTGSLPAAGAIGVFDLGAKTALYCAFERAWRE